MAELTNLAMCDIDEPQNALRIAMDDTKLAELVESIRAVGLANPILVKRVGDRFEVIDGHRRFKAHQQMQALNIRAIVYGADELPDEAAKLHSNLMREDNSDAELAIWLRELMEKHGYDLEALAKMTRRSEDWCSDRLRLFQGDMEVFGALAERKINFSVAKILNQCDREDYRRHYLKHAIISGAPARQVRSWIESVPMETVQPTPSHNGSDAPAPAPEPVDARISCAFCGGNLDPQNLVNVWVHHWEWAMLLKIRDGGPANA